MHEVLSQMAGLPFGIPHAEFAPANALNNSRLTCEEYVAYVSVDVVQNMDAIAWARVDRTTRLPELAQHFELLDDAQPKQCAPQPDVDDDMSATMETPGLLRKVCFLVNDLATAFRYAQDLGQRCAGFAHGRGEFFTVQQLTLFTETSAAD